MSSVFHINCQILVKASVYRCLIEGFGVRLGGLAGHEPGGGRWDQGGEGGMIWLFDVCIDVYDVEETSAPDGYSLPEDEDQECEISENTDPEQQ